MPAARHLNSKNLGLKQHLEYRLRLAIVKLVNECSALRRLAKSNIRVPQVTGNEARPT